MLLGIMPPFHSHDNSAHCVHVTHSMMQTPHKRTLLSAQLTQRVHYGQNSIIAITALLLL